MGWFSDYARAKSIDVPSCLGTEHCGTIQSCSECPKRYSGCQRESEAIPPNYQDDTATVAWEAQLRENGQRFVESVRLSESEVTPPVQDPAFAQQKRENAKGDN